MKKIFILTGVAILLSLGLNAHGQDDKLDDVFSFHDSIFTSLTDDTDVVDTNFTATTETLLPTLSKEEKEKIQNLLTAENASVIYDDDIGHIIYRQANNKYGFINIRMFSKPLLENQDSILTIHIGENEQGLLAKEGNKIAVYTYEGLLMIPQVTADRIVKISKNIYKSGQGRLHGYAIVMNGNKLYATDTEGRYYRLAMEKALMENNLIFGLKGSNIVVYTTDGSETEEVISDISDNDAEYEEVEILTSIGHVRYNYNDKKYSNISPGVVVKKKNHYWLYPGGERLHVKNLAASELLEGTINNKKVIFSKHFYPVNELKQKLNSSGN